MNELDFDLLRIRAFQIYLGCLKDSGIDIGIKGCEDK